MIVPQKGLSLRLPTLLLAPPSPGISAFAGPPGLGIFGFWGSGFSAFLPGLGFLCEDVWGAGEETRPNNRSVGL